MVVPLGRTGVQGVFKGCARQLVGNTPVGSGGLEPLFINRKLFLGGRGDEQIGGSVGVK
jgi:hypothetical protein